MERAEPTEGVPPPGQPRRLQRLLSAIWAGPVEPGGVAAEDQRAFDEYAAYALQIHAPRLLWTVAVAVLLTWPLDLLLAAPLGPAVLRLRVWTLGLLAAGALALPRLPGYARHPGPITAGALVALQGGLAVLLGALAPTGELSFALLAGLLLLTVPLPVGARVRAATLGAAVVLCGAGYAWGAASASAPGIASMSYLLLGGAGVFVLGHARYLLARDNFLARLRLSRQDELLRDLNENLETRVAEKALALRRLARHIERMREDERKWIAREIHDELGQELTAMRYAVALARHSAGPHAAGSLNDVQELLDRTRTTMRRILAALRPRVLDELGLVAGLDWLAKDLAARTGLAIHLEVEPGDLQLDGDGATVVFRIVQEALSNVLKHADARAAWVQLQLDGARLSLVVADDGRGLPAGADGPALLRADSGTLRPGHGLGLLGIRERADAVGGSVELATRPEGGTRLRVVMPFPIFPDEGALHAASGAEVLQ